jgi:hypothetical protein
MFTTDLSTAEGPSAAAARGFSTAAFAFDFTFGESAAWVSSTAGVAVSSTSAVSVLFAKRRLVAIAGCGIGGGGIDVWKSSDMLGSVSEWRGLSGW